MATKDEKIIVDLSQGTFVDTIYKNGALQLVEIGIDSLGQIVYADSGHWISSIITYPDKFKEYKNMEFTPVIQEGAAYKISVSSSDNMAIWSDYVEIDSEKKILNEKSSYVRIKIELFASKAHSEMVVDSFTTNGYNNDQIIIADGKLKFKKIQTLRSVLDTSSNPNVLVTSVSKSSFKKINSLTLAHN